MLFSLIFVYTNLRLWVQPLQDIFHGSLHTGSELLYIVFNYNYCLFHLFTMIVLHGTLDSQCMALAGDVGQLTIRSRCRQQAHVHLYSDLTAGGPDSFIRLTVLCGGSSVSCHWSYLHPLCLYMEQHSSFCR